MLNWEGALTYLGLMALVGYLACGFGFAIHREGKKAYFYILFWPVMLCYDGRKNVK